ncbi:MAG: xanthine dehydrogenase family protein molybdopterin-binding subunit, partial [Alphaproteobacteria bacterium]
AEPDLAFADGRYTVKGPDRSVGLAQVAEAAFAKGPWRQAVGFGLAERALYLPRGKTFPNGCHACEVEVDPETGAVELVGYAIVDDVGRVLNPLIVEGQVHGGVAQGVGQAVLERCVYDRDSGQLASGSLMDYCLPRAGDLPSFALSFNEVPCTTNPLGVKGVGEAGTTGSLPAVVNAALDALSDLGVRRLDMPLTPERVWRAIRECA